MERKAVVPVDLYFCTDKMWYFVTRSLWLPQIIPLVAMDIPFPSAMIGIKEVFSF
jgi:hypothetical protein